MAEHLRQKKYVHSYGHTHFSRIRVSVTQILLSTKNMKVCCPLSMEKESTELHHSCKVKLVNIQYKTITKFFVILKKHLSLLMLSFLKKTKKTKHFITIHLTDGLLGHGQSHRIISKQIKPMGEKKKKPT